MKPPNEIGNLCLPSPDDNGGRSRIYMILYVALAFSLFNFLNFASAVHHHQHLKEGTCEEYNPNMASLLGGLRDSHGASQNSADSDDLGRFAVDEHNKKQNSLLEFARVVKAQEQVVAGTLHHLTIEAIEAGKKKLYEAKVWVKPWMDFKELQEFKHVGDAPNITNSDLGAWRGDHPSGWQDVSVHDPEVQNAADHALKKIQERSNSLLPLELQEVAEAKAEVGNESAKFNMVLKVKRGSKEDKFNVEVHKKSDGNFHLNHFKPSE